MTTIINLIGLMIFTYLTFRIFSSGFDEKRIIGYMPESGQPVAISRNMYFITFMIATAPFFFDQFSLLKYLLFFCFLIYILCKSESRIKVNFVVISYLLFYSWCIIRGAYGRETYSCILVLIKYLLPLLSLWVAYNCMSDEIDLRYFCDRVMKFAIFYALFIGGFSATFMNWFYFSPIGSIFLKYAGLADYFSAIFIIPLIAYYLTKEKKYILVALWLVLSTLLESVRTGIGAMTICGALFFLYEKRLKSVPFLIGVGAVFLGAVLFVPSINEKFFGDKAGTIEAKDIVQGDAMSLHNINTSGRTFLWEYAMNKLYNGHEIIGSGTGMANHLIKSRGIAENTVSLLHNDYVQILCDNGIIGILLFGSFILMVLLYALKYSAPNRTELVRVLAMMSGASMGAVAFSMYFDNVVGHSMTSLIIPFVFLGFLFKKIDTERQ